MEPLDQARGARPQLGRQCGHHLELGGGHHRPQAELGGRAGQAGQKEGFRLLARHPGQAGPVPIDQADPAVGTPVGVDRHARRAQCLDVAMDRAHRDLELAGQLTRGQAAPGLEQEQQRDEA